MEKIARRMVLLDAKQPHFSVPWKESQHLERPIHYLSPSRFLFFFTRLVSLQQ